MHWRMRSVRASILASFRSLTTRHGRIQLRIILRRLAQEWGPAAVRSWQTMFDALGPGGEEVDAAAD